MTIIEAMQDPALFGRWFAGPTWDRWRVFLRALFALPLSEGEAAVFAEHTGRSRLPATPVKRATVIAGRRSGKTIVAALLAVFIAAFTDWRRRTAPGECAVVMILAADRKQARVAFRYLKAFINETPMLKAMVFRETRESIELSNGAAIEIHTASHRSVRGYTCAAIIADETAFWPTDVDSDRSDTETIAALEPTLATTAGLLLAVSSPYARRGYLWEQYRRHFGKDDSQRLVWVAPSLTMNPSLDPQIVAEALEQDEAAARSEWCTDIHPFRRDVETFVAQEAAAACVVVGRRELPPSASLHYVGFVDPSGGSVDSFTLAVAHRAPDGRAILDAIRERRPPFSPDAVVGEFALTLQLYGIRRVIGDAYSGDFVRESFRKKGIDYVLSSKPRSGLYGELLPLLNSERVELLEDARMIRQLCSLERRTTRSGKDSIDHPPNGNDDVINAAAGALVHVIARDPSDLGITI